MESNIWALTWALMTAIYACYVEGLDETCENQSVFCYSKGYKPLNIYLTAFTSDLALCLEKCLADNDCKGVAYNKQGKRCSLFSEDQLSNNTMYVPYADLHWKMPVTKKCVFNKPTGYVPSLQYHFDTLTPSMQIVGSVRLPAPSDGYSGPGACVDEIGPNNWITLETNPVGCPFEPQHCDDGFTWSFWLKFKTLGTGQKQILATNRPGIDIHYNSVSGKFVVNIYLETNAWYEHCDADDVGMPPRDDFFDWTHMAVVWQNIVPNPGPERTNGLKVFFNGEYIQCHSNYQPAGNSNTRDLTLGCAPNKESGVAACYDELMIYKYPLDDAAVKALSG